jgi:hypothetical protein
VGAHFYQPDPQQVTSHLNNLFDGLDPPMPTELAMRMVTHKGAISPNASAQKSQHNERLAFLGMSGSSMVYSDSYKLSVPFQDVAFSGSTFPSSIMHTLLFWHQLLQLHRSPTPSSRLL